jgi:hypothetical protein
MITFAKIQILFIASTISICRHNDMNLLVQNMEFNIFSDGSKRILNYIMCGSVFSPMNTMK